MYYHSGKIKAVQLGISRNCSDRFVNILVVLIYIFPMLFKSDEKKTGLISLGINEFECGPEHIYARKGKLCCVIDSVY